MEYGLIGEKLGHSFSKQIHGSIDDYDYILKEIPKDEVAAFMEKRDFKGINVTIPYKETVIPMLDEIDETAAEIGAVNTVVNRNGKLKGFNTDAEGMKAMLLREGMDFKDKKVLILGTGGTSKTALYVSKKLGAKQVFRVSRSEKDGCITYDEAYSAHSDANFIINTTPVGMYPETSKCPVESERFKNLSGVADAIFHPLRSNLILEAEARGIKACGGLYMLAGQAVYARTHFLGLKETDTKLIQKAYREVLKGVRNIVLIGMPSCGKSTVGKEIMRATGLPLFDTDSEIVKRIGCSISDFFKEKGEKEFRRIEREVIAELSKNGGKIISTGGGAVLDPMNVRELKRDGIIIFIDRSIDRLTPTADRPLLQNREMLEKLFKDRYGIYKAAADVTIDGNGSITENTKRVLAAADLENI
ncbi:MAG: shikimate dehydrogenase [Lachnospiraceae bacterium]|nr:shikimate dehydrogenase [Lachnospiraceae bacterium]